MAAKDYKLCVSPLTGTVYISKVSKKDPGIMTNDRYVLSKSEFIHCLVEWLNYEMEGMDENLIITEGKKKIFEIVDLREKSK